jgi:SPX domain protein involved in polyphosphate accumulation
MRYRHELKYVVSVRDAETLFRNLGSRIVPDTHADSDGCYSLASVYFDTSDRRFYWDREESVGFRRKVRLRCYLDSDGCRELHFEIKEKHGNITGKKRSKPLNLSVPEELTVADLNLDELLTPIADDPCAREILYLHQRLKLLPTVCTRYRREAYVVSTDPDVRVTFDRGVSATTGSIVKHDSTQDVLLLAPEYGILEIKCTRSFPSWLGSEVRRLGFPQMKFSKYCVGVRRIFYSGQLLTPGQGATNHSTQSPSGVIFEPSKKSEDR